VHVLCLWLVAVSVDSRVPYSVGTNFRQGWQDRAQELVGDAVLVPAIIACQVSWSFASADVELPAKWCLML
jgi:hypothetical protein